ncbi:MAG: exosome complex protein Rrp42 [Methanobacteriota archaeon]|nr:MAG: exosome complex protein Rrp42 [Euryarchaeota archaeon]
MREHIVKLVASGKRADGRVPEEIRPLKIRKNYIGTAEGSARVNLGNTDVLVGVKISTGEPYPDTPRSGVLTTSCELVPLASPTFESGPPSPTAIELARVVDRGIRETKTVDMEKLVITPGEKVWVVFIDIHALDYDGNLFDAASYGTLAALSCAKMPGRMTGGADKPLPVDHWPVSITAAKIRNTIVFDAALDEERIADARLTVAIDENGDVRAMQKGLSGSFSYDEVRYVISTARRLGNELRRTIQA